MTNFLERAESWERGMGLRRTVGGKVSEVHKPQATSPGPWRRTGGRVGRRVKATRGSAQPDSRLGSVPRPVEDDTHVEHQDLQMNKKRLRSAKGMTAGSMPVTSLGKKVKCETSGLGWEWGQLMAYNRGSQPEALTPLRGHVATFFGSHSSGRGGASSGWRPGIFAPQCIGRPLAEKELAGPSCQHAKCE